MPRAYAMIAGLVLLSLAGYARGAGAHDIGALHHQYSRLSPELARQLRQLDAVRTPVRARGLEAAAAAETGQRDAILNQFGLAGEGQRDFEQAYIVHTLWPAGHRFRVCFFDGDANARKHVFDVFEQIISRTNLRLDRTDRNCPDTRADIQIRFSEAACFSYYGKDSLLVIRENPNLSTMGLCGLAGPAWSARANGIIRHEIMHALGAVHEHQHPDSRCAQEFNLEEFRRRRYFDSDPQRNNEAIRTNIEEITQQYSRDQILLFPYDEASNMHYQGESWQFLNPSTATCLLLRENNELSRADWTFLERVYPRS